MAFRLRRKEAVADGVRRIAREEIDRALAEIADAALPLETKVHEVRKHCKKLRGLVRLVRPAFPETAALENAWFRDAARDLSSTRDADVLLRTVDKLAERYRAEVDPAAFAPVVAALKQHRQREVEQGGPVDARLEQFAGKMREARERIEAWTPDDTGFDAVGAGVERNYRRGRKALAVAYADPTPANFHEWRKRVKYHWYHMRLLSGLWKQEMQVRRDAADLLSDLLGDDHDLAVLRDRLSAQDFGLSEDDGAALAALADRRRGELQATARSLGLRLFAEKPSCLTQRLKKYWQAWRKERKPQFEGA